MGYFLKYIFLFIGVFVIAPATFSQSAPQPFINNRGQLNYSSLDNWYTRKVQESIILSGKPVELFGIGIVAPNADNFDLKLKDHHSPWGATNIYTKMFLDIGNSRVFPEKRGEGYCARLESRIRKDNIVGFEVEVLIAGTLFLGELIEPVKGMKDPLKNVNQGIPFNRKPKAIKFDYKYTVGNKRVQATTKVEPVAGTDLAEFCVILQKRWEDVDGNVFATRIGGARQFFSGSQTQWINGAEFPVTYGDPTRLPEYNEKTMGLIPGVGEVFVKNSKNKVVPLIETGWGKKPDTPTHMIMYFTSSYEGIKYVGSTETVFWVDNIELIY